MFRRRILEDIRYVLRGAIFSRNGFEQISSSLLNSSTQTKNTSDLINDLHSTYQLQSV